MRGGGGREEGAVDGRVSTVAVTVFCVFGGAC